MKTQQLFATLLMSVGLMSCLLPSSDNPLDDPPGSSIDPTPYLGEWNLVSIGGETDIGEEPLVITLAQTGNDLTMTLDHSTGSVEEIFKLTKENGKTFASLVDADDMWDIFRVTLLQSGSRLKVESMNMVTLKSDIENEVIEGEVPVWTERDKMIHLTASGAELRSYVASHPGVFHELFVFDKVP